MPIRILGIAGAFPKRILDIILIELKGAHVSVGPEINAGFMIITSVLCSFSG